VEEMIDMDVYFSSIRDTMFAGSMDQVQVDGQCVLIGLWNYQSTGTPMDDLRWLAYLLATTYHETATVFWPIREYGLGKGKDYGIPDENGNVFYGRGFVQLTWKENYDRASALLALVDDRDLTLYPDVALDSLIAARVLFRGCAEGWFTGAKLGDYFSETEDDPLNARRIINGNDKDELIAGYYDLFLDAVQEAYYDSPGRATVAPGWIGT
jgi:hypothetical protein